MKKPLVLLLVAFLAPMCVGCITGDNDNEGPKVASITGAVTETSDGYMISADISKSATAAGELKIFDISGRDITKAAGLKSGVDYKHDTKTQTVTITKSGVDKLVAAGAKSAQVKIRDGKSEKYVVVEAPTK